MVAYKRGEKVFIRDYPLGNPTNVHGTVVGILENDYYNIRIESGWNEGKIISFKYWKLISFQEINKNTCKIEE